MAEVRREAVDVATAATARLLAGDGPEPGQCPDRPQSIKELDHQAALVAASSLKVQRGRTNNPGLCRSGAPYSRGNMGM